MGDLWITQISEANVFFKHGDHMLNNSLISSYVQLRKTVSLLLQFPGSLRLKDPFA